MAALLKEHISLGLAYRFRDLVHYHHGRKLGSTQAGMVLDKEPIIRQQEENDPAPALSFLQQGHT